MANDDQAQPRMFYTIASAEEAYRQELQKNEVIATKFNELEGTIGGKLDILLNKFDELSSLLKQVLLINTSVPAPSVPVFTFATFSPVLRPLSLIFLHLQRTQLLDYALSISLELNQTQKSILDVHFYKETASYSPEAYHQLRFQFNSTYGVLHHQIRFQFNSIHGVLQLQRKKPRTNL
jgi:hypothetical protein